MLDLGAFTFSLLGFSLGEGAGGDLCFDIGVDFRVVLDGADEVFSLFEGRVVHFFVTEDFPEELDSTEESAPELLDFGGSFGGSILVDLDGGGASD